MIVWYVMKNRSSTAALNFSNLQGLKKTPFSYKYIFRHVLFVFRCLALFLIIIVMMRPHSVNKWKNVTSEGIDIMMALDISGSMLAEDFHPNRIEAAKNVISEFITGRPTDRIGLVVFSSESFTQCPLTTDHAVLINLLHDIKFGMIEDGTAIGDGIANSINRLKDSKAVSKVVILLTDGENNRGEIAPITAAEIAKTYGVRVYTIGVGTIGTAPIPVETPFGKQYQQMEVKIDEPLLQQIAKTTGGKYFRATNNEKLRGIYAEIDKMEKTKIEVSEHKKYEEEYFMWGLAAFILIIMEFLIKNTILRTIP